MKDALGWPAFDAPVLQAVSAAFRRRYKAISYHGTLSCLQEFDETADRSYERMNIDFNAGLQLRLSLWEDGKMWLRVCIPGQGRNSGWSFLDHFHGEIRQLNPTDLVEKFEATITLCSTDIGEDRRENLRRLWQAVGPYNA